MYDDDDLFRTSFESVGEDPGPERTRPEEFYTIVSVNSKYVKRFRTQGDRYVVRFNEIDPIVGIENVIQMIGEVFDSLLERIMRGFAPQDLVGVTIRFPGLQEDFWLDFTHRDLLSVETLLSE